MSTKLIKMAIGGTRVSFNPISVSADLLSPTEAIAGFRFDSDGFIYTSNTNPESYSSIEQYIFPASASATHYIRITRTGGTETNFTAGSTGVWLQLNIDRTWTLNRNTTGQINIVFTIEISPDNGSTIIYTRTGNDLTAEQAV